MVKWLNWLRGGRDETWYDKKTTGSEKPEMICFNVYFTEILVAQLYLNFETKFFKATTKVIMFVTGRGITANEIIPVLSFCGLIFADEI